MEPPAMANAVSTPDKLHVRPEKLPLPATRENIPKLREILVQEFKSTFTKSTPFSKMNTKPVHIHLKPDAVPFATHVPIPVPLH